MHFCQFFFIDASWLVLSIQGVKMNEDFGRLWTRLGQQHTFTSHELCTCVYRVGGGQEVRAKHAAVLRQTVYHRCTRTRIRSVLGEFLRKNLLIHYVTGVFKLVL